MKFLFFKDIKPRHKKILSFIKDKRAKLYLAAFCMIVYASTTAAQALLLKDIIDDIFIKQNVRMLKLLPVAVIIIFMIRGFTAYFQEFFMNYVGESIIRQLRDMLYEKIINLPLSFFQDEKTGALMSRITYDVSIVKTMVSTAVTNSIRDVFQIIFLTGVIFYRDWKTALIAILILPAAFYPIVELGRRMRKISTGCQEAMADLNSFLHETFSGNKIVKAFGMENYEKGRFFEKTHHYFRLEMKSVMIRSLSNPIMEFLAGIGIAVVIAYGGYKVISGASTPGTFTSFLGAVMMLYDPVRRLSGLNNAVQQGLAASDRVFEILEFSSPVTEVQNPMAIQTKPHTVTFDNVSFKYDRDWVLKNINLKVKDGEIVALVGMSGGGKTSLVNLIPRFYDVIDGQIMVDDNDIRQASIDSLRSQIAIVTQEPILFNDTVKNNIAYGNLNASDHDIEQAAKAAYAYDFIMNFPKGFDTNIGELGSRLSGGQKQRICIARALLKDAPILILDEATSALDTESEMLVQKALENLMKGRTTFVIAHRLSTIGYAHRVIVLVDGQIVEEGRHDELIKKQGEYYKLHQLQYS